MFRMCRKQILTHLHSSIPQISNCLSLPLIHNLHPFLFFRRIQMQIHLLGSISISLVFDLSIGCGTRWRGWGVWPPRWGCGWIVPRRSRLGGSKGHMWFVWQVACLAAYSVGESLLLDAVVVLLVVLVSHCGVSADDWQCRAARKFGQGGHHIYSWASHCEWQWAVDSAESDQYDNNVASLSSIQEVPNHHLQTWLNLWEMKVAALLFLKIFRIKTTRGET